MDALLPKAAAAVVMVIVAGAGVEDDEEVALLWFCAEAMLEGPVVLLLLPLRLPLAAGIGTGATVVAAVDVVAVGVDGVPVEEKVCTTVVLPLCCCKLLDDADVVVVVGRERLDAAEPPFGVCDLDLALLPCSIAWSFDDGEVGEVGMAGGGVREMDDDEAEGMGEWEEACACGCGGRWPNEVEMGDLLLLAAVRS